MACRLTELVIDSRDPETLARWWAEVLDYRVIDVDDETAEIAGPHGSAPTLLFAKVPERKTIKNRIHIDVNPTDREQPDELQRLLGMGATRVDVGQGEDVSWFVLSDPEGNEFCLLKTRRDP